MTLLFSLKSTSTQKPCLEDCMGRATVHINASRRWWEYCMLPTTEDNTQPHSHLQLQLYDCNKKQGKWAILGAPSQMWSEWCA